MQSDIEIKHKEITFQKQRLTELYVKHNTKGKSYKDFERDMDRDNFMTAEEAVEYGLADKASERKPINTYMKIHELLTEKCWKGYEKKGMKTCSENVSPISQRKKTLMSRRPQNDPNF